MLRRIGLKGTLRAVIKGVVLGVVLGAALAASACLAWPEQALARGGSKHRGGAHLYVLLGWMNMSPGLSEFGSRIGHRGIPTTVRNHNDWPALAQEAIAQYKSGRLRSIMIVGHSLGGSAAMAMAAELGQAGVPVQLVATLDPVGGMEKSSNVRRSVNIRPKDNEDHYSVIAAHDRELRSYVLGGKLPRGSRTAARRQDLSPPPLDDRYVTGTIN
jgi:pimeloyl-ACP methyl ester carboxylesterase